MPYSSGSYSAPASTWNPAVALTTISTADWAALLSDLSTALSTCVLKDGSQTITANIPMSGFKLTGLAAGSASGNSLRYEQVNGVVTTAGDMLYATGAGALARLAIGTAGGLQMVNAGATAPSWLAIGTARQQLVVNSGATAVEYVASLQSLMTGTGDIVQSSGANTPARLALGTARQVPQVNAGATALAYANPITLGTMQATTSGTAFDFTSIPSGVRRITMNLAGVSLSGTDNLLVQIGDAGGIENTNYISTATDVAGGSATATASSTAGFLIRGADASTIHSGSMVLNLVNAATFQWVASYVGKPNTAANGFAAGDKALSAELTQIRLTRSGTDTFDAGAVNISYE